jgi:DNA-binding NarL/FixJ family response regulator
LVLVAEDEPFIALDIALAVEDAGGEVMGPVATREEALALIASGNVAAAILDINLADGEGSGVVEALLDLKVPFIVHTAVCLPPAIAARVSPEVVKLKPCAASDLVAHLERVVADHPGRGAAA